MTHQPRQQPMPVPETLAPIVSILAEHELVSEECDGLLVRVACACRRWDHERTDGNLRHAITKHRSHVASRIEDREQVIRSEVRAEVVEEFEVMGR